MNTSQSAINSDKTGIVSAIICTIHCLVFPVFFMLQNFWKDSRYFSVPTWWEKLDFVFIVIGFLAVYSSTRHTSFKFIKYALWFFWTVLAVAILFSSRLHWLSYPASMGLILTHFRNLKLMSKK